MSRFRIILIVVIAAGIIAELVLDMRLGVILIFGAAVMYAISCLLAYERELLEDDPARHMLENRHKRDRNGHPA